MISPYLVYLLIAQGGDREAVGCVGFFSACSCLVFLLCRIEDSSKAFVRTHGVGSPTLDWLGLSLYHALTDVATALRLYEPKISVNFIDF